MRDSFFSGAALRRLIDVVLSRLIGGTPSAGDRTFLRHFGYLFSSDLAATALTFALSVWIIRQLGPAEFGLANLVGSSAQLLLVPMLLGIHAAAARTAATSKQAGDIVGAALLIIAGLIPGVSLATLMFSEPLAAATGVPRDVLYWSLPLAASLVLQHVGSGILSGLHRFGRLARINIWSATVYAAVVLILLAKGQTWTFVLFTVVTALRSLAAAALCVAHVWRMVRWPTAATIRPLLNLGLVYTLGSVAYFFALGSIDSLMLNYFHGPVQVGIYGAYFAAFNIVASRVTKIVSDILMPTASAHGHPALLAARAKRVFLRVGFALVPAGVLLCRVLFVAYGSEFPFSWMTATLLSVCIYLHLGLSIAGDLLMAVGLKGLRLSTGIAFLTGAANVAGNLLLIPPFGVPGSLVATLLAASLGLLLRAVALDRFTRRAVSPS